MQNTLSGIMRIGIIVKMASSALIVEKLEPNNSYKVHELNHKGGFTFKCEICANHYWFTLSKLTQKDM